MGARAYLPALLPALVGAVFLVLDHRSRALVLLSIAAVAAVLVTAGVDLATPMARLVEVIVRWVTNALSWAVGVVVLVPAWAWTRVRGVDVLRRGDGPGWVVLEHSAASTPPGRTVRHRARVRSVVGLVVLVLVADVALGVAWNRVTGSGPAAPPGLIRIDPPDSDEPDTPGSVVEGPRDPRADLPAMASSPWAAAYFQELNSVGSVYWPFTLYRPRSFAGEHLNVRGWERLGHRPADAEGAPVLALFGGSAAFGEGQRDGGTIASQLSVLAEASGVPVVVRNFGQRGWVLWQEMTLYEQLLASGERVDLAAFYDGANDLTVQNEVVNGVPTHYDVEEYALRLAQPTPDTSVSTAERGLWREVVTWWRARSALRRSLQGLGVVEDPSPTPDDAEPTEREGWDERGVDVYARSRGLVEHLSSTYGVEDAFFWQPQRLADERYAEAARAVAPTTVDLSGVLDGHEEVYLDAVHTNEEGARLVAEAMWVSLEPVVRDWYRRNR